MKRLLCVFLLITLSACSTPSISEATNIEGYWVSANGVSLDITDDLLTTKNAEYNYKINHGDLYLYLLDEQQDVPYTVIDVTNDQEKALSDSETYYVDDDLLIFRMVSYYRDQESAAAAQNSTTASKPQSSQDNKDDADQKDENGKEENEEKTEEKTEEEKEPEPEPEPASIVGLWNMDGSDIQVKFEADGQVFYTDQVYVVSWAFDDYGQLIINVGYSSIVFLPAYSLEEALSSKIYYYFDQENLVFGAQLYTRAEDTQNEQNDKQNNRQQKRQQETNEDTPETAE